jgi:transposase
MDIVVEKGCGLDVHKETVVACIGGSGIKKEVRTYSTFTQELLRLKEWLKGQGITHVAMESTGIYWKPVFNILEDDFEVILVNARHIKHVPGRKTDVCDSEWLCKLLRNGLVKGSYIPVRDMRELRDLTRYRKKLVHAIASEKNRIQKILEDANIKLSSVVSDTFGVSGSAIIEALLRGELTTEEMSNLARGKLKKKKDVIRASLVGKVTQHHVFMIKTSLEHIKSVEKLIDGIDREKEQKLENYRDEYELLQTIPGVKGHGAASILAEIGTEMERFPTAEHLSSWAGMSPGNNESGGKKKVCGTTHGNKSLRTTLTECAWAASRKKDCYLRAKYHSLVGRRGKKRALIAVGHKILIASYHILKHKVGYKELGGDYLDKRRKEKITRSYVKRLASLGYQVTLADVA